MVSYQRNDVLDAVGGDVVAVEVDVLERGAVVQR